MLQTRAQPSWYPKFATFILSAVAVASAVFWGLNDWRNQVPPEVSVALSTPSPVTASLVARALGGGDRNGAWQAPSTAAHVAPFSSTRFTLVGIVANPSGGGVALISTDGKAAKPVRVGAFVDDRLLLQSVAGRRALLATGLGKPIEVTLELLKPAK